MTMDPTSGPQPDSPRAPLRLPISDDAVLVLVIDGNAYPRIKMRVLPEVAVQMLRMIADNIERNNTPTRHGGYDGGRSNG